MATKTEVMETLKNKLNENNEAILKDEALPHSEEILKQEAKTLTSLAVQEEFANWKNTEDPLKTAINALLVPNFTVRKVKDNDSGIESFEINERKRVFDLGAFCKFCAGKRITHDISYVGKLGVAQTLFAARVAKELGLGYKEILESHRLPKSIVRNDVTQMKNPISNSTIEESLQALVDAIYWSGEGEVNDLKMRSKDVKFIVYRNTKRGKEYNAINSGNSRSLCETVLIMIHCMMNNKDYTVEYDKVKD